MGIKNLKYLINKYAADAVNERFLNTYENKIIAIDTSIYLYRFIYKNGEPLELLSKQVMRFLKNKIIPLYIFDGKPPKEKGDVLDERNERKKELYNRHNQIKYLIKKKEIDEQIDSKINEKIEDILNENILNEDILNNKEMLEELVIMNINELREELDRVDKRIIIVNGKTISDCKYLFKLMGVPYLVANGEAESLCASLVKRGLIHGCLSEDTDILANGSKYFIRNFNVNNNKIIEYDLEKILKLFEVSYEQFIDICILCGCDYTSSIKNIGVEKAYKYIKETGNIEGVLEYVAMVNNKYREKNGGVRYVIPQNFDYKKARELFLTCGDKEDYEMIKKCIKLTSPQVDNLLKYLENLEKSIDMNDIKRNLKKFHNILDISNQSTIDKFF